MNSSNLTINSTDEAMDSACPDSATGLHAYACFYWHIHGVASLILCCFGIPTNIVNVIILTRKNMRTPINYILSGIAISDALTMLDYVPFVVHFYILNGVDRTPEKYTHFWTWYLVFHSNLSITTHTISIWLGVCMAIVRYTFIRSMGRGQHTINNQRACFVVAAVFVLSVIAYIPNYAFSNVMVRPYLDANNNTLYYYEIKNLQLGGENQTTIAAVGAWSFILFGKLFPCIFISVFGGLLLHTLHESKKRTMSLRGAHCEERLKQHQRTTVMLLAIVLMFILAEMPSSIAVFIGLVRKDFFQQIYPLLADTLDMLSLLNNTANFVMYCAMSRQFRDCLMEVACDKLARTPDQSYSAVKSNTATTATMTAIHIPVINNKKLLKLPVM